MKIIYYASDDTMGDTSPDNCEHFRKWAENEIYSKFPNHDVYVSGDPSLQTAYTDDIENEDAIFDFCGRLWDACTWDWLA